jgi:prophage antirepressor-like protein
MSSIVNIFDNLLKYNDKNVFIIMDIHNNIWFKIKDVLKLLDYTGSNKFTRIKGVNDENICKMKYIQIGTSMSLPSNMQPNTVFINEAGLYQLLSNSHKKMAVDFRNDLFTNILPTIRKTGSYKMQETDNNKLKRLNQKLKNKMKKLEEENNYYEDKHIYKPTNNSYVYIIKKDIGRKKCYKIGYTDDIEKRLTVYRTSKPGMKIIYYIAIIFDGKQTEDCIKSINKLHEMKNKTDDLCFLSLKQLKNSIIDCLDMMKTHVCKCNLCKKKLHIKDIDKHFCD